MRHPISQSGFLERVADVVRRDIGCSGAFSETVRVAGGEVLSYRFPFATGMGWLHFRSRYRETFGARHPDWLDKYHPWVRLCLCRMAVAEGRMLPPEAPVVEPVRADGSSPRRAASGSSHEPDGVHSG